MQAFFLRLLIRLWVMSNGYFLKVLCGTFTLKPLCGGYFTQNMSAPGKV